jgi:hypothetical protein
MTRPPSVRCAGCGRQVQKLVSVLEGRHYGPCCWVSRGPEEVVLPCRECGSFIPEEDMVTFDLCKRCAEGMQRSV